MKAAEAPLGGTRLTDAVARNLFKLMAYKDEYEVARLHTDPAFLAKLADQFEDGFKLKYHLAPPLLAAKNAKGELVKKTYGGWMKSAFGVLAKFKGLRGTAFDVFGYTEERRMERALIVEYRALVDELLGSLSADRLADAVALASLPEEIRGYGHVKERHLVKARAKWDTLLAAWRAGARRRRRERLSASSTSTPARHPGRLAHRYACDECGDRIASMPAHEARARAATSRSTSTRPASITRYDRMQAIEID